MTYQPSRHGGTARTPGLRDLAVVLAHYSGIRQHAYGRSTKCEDRFGAPQCSECHANGPFSEGWVRPGTEHWDRYARKVDASEEQLHQIAMWHLSLARRGIVVR